MGGCKLPRAAGFFCPHCKLRLCESHRFPDQHGCAEAQKQAEMQRAQKEHARKVKQQQQEAQRKAASVSARKLKTRTSVSTKIVLMKARGLAKPVRAGIPAAKRRLVLLAIATAEPDARGDGDGGDDNDGDGDDGDDESVLTSIASQLHCTHVHPCFAHVDRSLADVVDAARPLLGGVSADRVRVFDITPPASSAKAGPKTGGGVRPQGEGNRSGGDGDGRGGGGGGGGGGEVSALPIATKVGTREEGCVLLATVTPAAVSKLTREQARTLGEEALHCLMHAKKKKKTSKKAKA
ncbi:hypothetical protein PTSG_11862 [Salpingoeca rosetta]|uniref:AN1-type domain-containing protein n=1 Tax=Salpingoeca rosetta (strain ATCC 50818 / BSB-021) TaxID=946362 RepID=F2U1Q5_SALR5|nr:uncharacterized protein PTSG_11862 [Salpingoeca rosetta]EGD81557.1 hypothetical protein PTSG_11862 [Salpingoeca rosetta]|eukprot:XP_004996761.1 hypothetical protein PTSG_11862 [Salpingoeca rosetta]